MYTFGAATGGEDGRKYLMREIELRKLIGENVSPNIVKFMGCVTKESTKRTASFLSMCY